MSLIFRLKFKFNHFLILSIILWGGLLVLGQPTVTQAASNYSGYIFLQVESHGEAWYINPTDQKRYYLGTPADSFAIMREFGLGISNADFIKFSVNPPARLAGRILIEVQNQGRAYYVDPSNLHFYYLGRPADAWQIERSRGRGITNADLAKIPMGATSANPASVSGGSGANTTNTLIVNSGEKAVTYTWKYKSKPYSLTEILSDDLYNDYKNSPKVLTYNSDNPPANMRDAFYGLFLTVKSSDTLEDKIITDLKKMAAAQNFSDDETVEFVMAFIQYIPYDDSKTTGAAANFVYETLYKDSGICSDKSFLSLALLRKLGYGAIMFDYPDDNHSAIGISCPTDNSTYQTGYCYAETTSYFPIGMVPPSLKSNGAASTAINDLTDAFSAQNLGKVETYQQTSGKSYGNIQSTISQVAGLRSLVTAASSTQVEIDHAKTALDTAQVNANSLVAELHTYQTAGNATAYNSLVPTYNAAVQDYNSKLDAYHSYINLFNSYIQQYNDNLKSLFQK